MSGRITSIVAVDANSTIIYAGAGFWAVFGNLPLVESLGIRFSRSKKFTLSVADFYLPKKILISSG